jgi:zinc transport system substrate-binding protein
MSLLRPLLHPSSVAALLMASCLWSSFAAQAAPVVAVSIKPLEHLVSELTIGVTTPQLVVRPSQDPHHLALRPSERRVLANADLLLWVGPAMELPLQELVQQIDARVLTAQTLDGIRLLPVGSEPDPHLWLDTHNAERIAEAVVQQLVQLDSDNRARYEANLAAFRTQLHTLRLALQQQQTLAGPQPWAVYHHAFRYTEAEFGLTPALSLRDSDNVEPGVRSVLAFRAALQDAQLSCLVVEAGMHHGSLESLLDEANLRTVEADVLGIELAVQPGSFAALIDGVMQAIQSCAGAGHE